MSEDVAWRRSIERRPGVAGARHILVFVAAVALLAACRTTAPSGPGDIKLEGMASWYGQEFAGRPTANGEIFDPESMSAAHRTLPFGTIVDVTNMKNGLTTRVRINDRGPFVGNRIIDLSYAAARSLGMVEDGISRVRLEIVRLGKGEREPPKPYAVKIESEPTKSVPVVPDTPVPPAPPPAPEPVETIDEEPVVTEEFTPVETASPVPAPMPESPAPQPAPYAERRGWKVQVGAFGVEENANRLARELRAFVSPVYVDLLGGLHRVRVGPFSSRADAIDAKERLDASGYDSILLSPDAR